MGPLGKVYLKTLLPVANEPVIGHQLRMLGGLGVREVFVVVASGSSAVADAVGDGRAYGVSVSYVEQESPLGSANALGRLRQHVHRPFLLLLGDYFFSATEPERLIARLLAGASAIAVKQEPERRLVKEACWLDVDGEGRVLEIVEKPTSPATDLKGCGFYALQPEVFDAVARTPRTELRDEYELTVALEIFVRRDHPFYAEHVIDWDSNLTRPSDVLDCNLEWLESSEMSELISERALVEKGALLDRAVVGEHALVAANASLREVVVFPGAQIVDGAVIERALVTSRDLISCGD